MTVACLDSIAAETRATVYEIIVIDNDLHDGSADAIAASHPEVRLIRSKKTWALLGQTTWRPYRKG